MERGSEALSHLCQGAEPGVAEGGFWQHVEAGLQEQVQRLRTDLTLSRQESRELQERLMVSEATVLAQSEQLKEYRELLYSLHICTAKACFANIACAAPCRKYGTLIQAQARELSHLRQRMREGCGICHALAQHLDDTTKAFEELLRGNDVDYYMGQSFREQLAGSQALASRVRAKISGRESLWQPTALPQ
uniref:Uncharacterized protein n=1 Tax=Paramormyrops kingsleyae TaxID=1676925 RepID=A0A3B3TB60_9TELE